MSIATLATTAPPVEDDSFPHQSWCVEHWSDDAVCWADDLVLQVRPADGDDTGRITGVMTHGSRSDACTGAPALNLTLFADTVRDGEGSVEFDPDEAEIAAHALLAMVSLGRGETSAADWHRTTAEQKAAALLASRMGGAS